MRSWFLSNDMLLALMAGGTASALVPILGTMSIAGPALTSEQWTSCGGTAGSERFSDQAVVHCKRIEGGQLHETESMRKEFACPVCDSPAIVYPEEGEEDEEDEEDRVTCGGCGAFLATRNQFRRLVEEHAEVQTSGC
jgi:hypothetical protein